MMGRQAGAIATRRDILHKQADSTRSALIAAAVRLFHERGYPNVTVQDVVDAVGVTKGAFYYYLVSKEELLYLIHDEVISHNLETAERALALGLSPTETLRQMVTDLCETVQRFKAHVMVFVRDMHFLSAEHLEQIKAKRDRYEGYFVQVIKAAQEAGEFRSDLDPRMASFALLGMCNWMYRWFKPEGRYQADEIARMFHSVFLQGMATSATGPAAADPITRQAPGCGAGHD